MRCLGSILFVNTPQEVGKACPEIQRKARLTVVIFLPLGANNFLSSILDAYWTHTGDWIHIVHILDPYCTHILDPYWIHTGAYSSRGRGEGLSFAFWSRHLGNIVKQLSRDGAPDQKWESNWKPKLSKRELEMKAPGTTVKVSGSVRDTRNASPHNQGIQHRGQLGILVLVTFSTFFLLSFDSTWKPFIYHFKLWTCPETSSNFWLTDFTFHITFQLWTSS